MNCLAQYYLVSFSNAVLRVCEDFGEFFELQFRVFRETKSRVCYSGGVFTRRFPKVYEHQR